MVCNIDVTLSSTRSTFSCTVTAGPGPYLARQEDAGKNGWQTCHSAKPQGITNCFLKIPKSADALFDSFKCARHGAWIVIHEGRV